MPLRLPFRLSCRREGRCLAALLLVQACGMPSGPQVPQGSSVVQLLLRADQVSHVGSVRDMVTLEPVAASNVDLELHGPAGDARLSQTGDELRVAGFPVTPGAEYRLDGRVDGNVVTGRVVVPGRLLVRLPRSGDTIRVLSANAFSYPLPVDMEAAGAVGYRVEQISPTGAVLRGEWHRSGIGVVNAIVTADHLHRFRVYAFDTNAWRFLVTSFGASSSSLAGVRGFVGAAVIDSFAVTVIR